MRFAVVSFLSLFASGASAQDFELIERRLGGIVADGELSLQQAHVMLRALHEQAYQHEQHVQMREQFERSGVDPRSIDRVHHALEEHGLQGERGKLAMQVLLQMIRRNQGNADEFEVPENLQDRLREEAGLSDEQIELISELAARLNGEANAGRRMNRDSDNPISMKQQQVQEKIVRWIESFETELETAVGSENLSEDQASLKWRWFKTKKLEPKLEAAMENQSLSEAQVKSIWAEIEEREAERREAGR